MVSFFSSLLLLLSICIVSSQAAANLNYYAAKCCADTTSCSTYSSYMSGVCMSKRWMSAQSSKCQKAACDYCRWGDRRTTDFVCSSEPIKKNCALTRLTLTSKSGSYARKCYFHLYGDNFKIMAKDMQPEYVSYRNKNWSEEKGFLVWKSYSWDRHHIDTNKDGHLCGLLKPKHSGWYSFAVTSYAEHGTEFNDAWFKINNGFMMFKNGHLKNTHSEWIKGYQNTRNSDIISHKDHDPHQLLVWLDAGSTRKLCVAGRSSRFFMKDFTLVYCGINTSKCSRDRQDMKNKLSSMKYFYPNC